jgi:hypothetical protein
LRRKPYSLIFTAACLFLTGDAALAYQNLLDNFFSPFPPGCATLPSLQETFYPGDSRVLIDGDIFLDGMDTPDAVTARFTVSRSSCADEGRAVLIARLELLDDGDGQLEAAAIPAFAARIDGVERPLRAALEPGSWISDETYRLYTEGSIVEFVFDIPTPLSPNYDQNLIITPTQYNEPLTLLIRNPLSAGYNATIGGYDNDLRAAHIPLNGRLSGVWVVEQASDQGFVISFSDLPGDTGSGVVFFSWYTFDTAGNAIWLVGNVNFEFGDVAVTFDLQLLSDGRFLGNENANRTQAGTVTLTAMHCNLLELEFDLGEIGLGHETIELRRAAGIETAGYSCMDIETKLGQ